jgi:hypothetical protein
MMGIQPSEMRRLTWWEYQALLWTWNDRHDLDGGDDVEAPDADFVARRQERLAERGLMKVLN